MARRNLIGLDIGSRFIKALQVTLQDGEPRITEFGITEVAPGESLVDALRGLIRRGSFRTTRAAVAVSGRSVFVRIVPIAVMSDAELANAAKYELGKYIPIEVDEVQHDCQRLDEPEPGAQEMRVVLAAARRAYLDERIALVEQAGLIPHVVDVEFLALANAYELAARRSPELPGQGRVVAVVDVGAATSNVVILDDLKCVFTREFYRAGDDITEVVARKLGVESAQAERVKREPGARAEEVAAAVEGVLEDAAQDVKVSVEYYENQQDRQVELVYLTGGSCGIPGVREVMQRVVGRPVEVWNPLEGMAVQMAPESETAMRAHAWKCAIALGLGTRFE